MVFVSACLWGENCKYTGDNNLREYLRELLADEEVVLCCPECFGGLPTPRYPSEIEPGKDGIDVINKCARVVNSKGKDVTDEFIKGAKITLEMAQKLKPSKIYLKESSPSCGSGKIYDGTFGGVKKEGVGITAALLIQNGFDVIAVE